ncbi:ribbon-helix-helix protein, CopG family [Phormidium nigroviride]|jgi:metal-responsive CopG/Arc/MetJ family transcriptional regulator
MTEEKAKNKAGRPGLYSEPKEKVSLALTKTAIHNLEELASQLGVSRSELVEQVARGIIPLGQPLEKKPAS